MPTPCSVCSLANRHEVDQLLARPGVNVSALARDNGVGRDALKRHKAQHLAPLIASFAHEDLEYSAGSIRAQLRQLFERGLRALDQAEAGELVRLSDDGREIRKVSTGAIVSCLREARQTLGAMYEVGARETESDTVVVVNASLDDRVMEALRRVGQREVMQANPLPVVDVEGDEPST